MNDPMLAYFLFVATNVVIASLTAVTYLSALWPILAYTVAGIACVSLIISGAFFLYLFVGRKPLDTTSEEENEAQIAYLDEWRQQKNRASKNLVDAVSSNEYK